jgi:hypothetical protein
MKPWTTGEVRLLREYYAKVGATECALMLERTAGAIWTKAYKMGLTEKNPQAAQRFNPRRGIPRDQYRAAA